MDYKDMADMSLAGHVFELVFFQETLSSLMT